MKLKAKFDTYQQTKKCLKITLIIDEGIPEIIKNISNFHNKPLIIDMNIDASSVIIESEIITDDQRKKIYVMLKEFSGELGISEDECKIQLKNEFCNSKEIGAFSLSDVPKQTATEFIEYLGIIGYKNGWIKRPPINYFNDTEKLFFISTKIKKCVCCGKDGDVYNNNTICLCKNHYSEICKIGIKEFYKKYCFEEV